MRTVTIDGLRMGYVASGPEDAPTILFASGLLFGCWIFDAQIRALSPYYRCVAFDWRGHGRSTVTRSGYDMDTFTDDVAALIGALNLGAVHFVGLSMGGFVGQRLAARHPGIVRSLVLLNTSADRETKRNVQAFKRLAILQHVISARRLASLAAPAMFGADYLALPASRDVLERWILDLRQRHRGATRRTTMAVAERNSVVHELAAIRSPTLVLGGADDRGISRAAIDGVAASIPGARLDLIADCGHMSCLEQPIRVTAALRDFFAAVDLKTGGERTKHATDHRDHDSETDADGGCHPAHPIVPHVAMKAERSAMSDAHPKPVEQSPAVVGDYDGSTLSYRDLNRHANQFAHYLRSAGVTRTSDVVAVLMDNDVHFYEIVAGIERSGGAYAAVNYDLSEDAIRYIVRDAQPAVLLTSPRFLDLAIDEADEATRILVVASTSRDVLREGVERYPQVTAGMPADAVPDPGGGGLLNYTSGSTGLPKAIRYAANRLAIEDAPREAIDMVVGAQDSVYLVPSPVYHNLPGLISTIVHRRGGTVVVLRDFTPEHVLASIERYGVTHTMIPPSLLAAMSKLPTQTKQRYSTSTLRGVLHDAAPCAPVVKQAVIDWWGPILNEFYGASDVGGFTFITGQEWIKHPGSVGRPLTGIVEIRGPGGDVMPPGRIGEIWLGGPQTASPSVMARHGEAQLGDTGDVGYLDEDGYLFHMDRRSNIVTIDGRTYYPEQIEHALIGHPAVADVAVVRAPAEAAAARMVAVIQPLQWPPAPELNTTLSNFCVHSPTLTQTPLSFEFVDRLPRAATGKLYRNQIAIK